MSVYELQPRDGEAEKLTRRRLQRNGYVFQRSGTWYLQYWDGHTERKRKTVQLGPSEGRGKINETQARRIAWDQHLSKLDQTNIYPGLRQTVENFVQTSFQPNIVQSLKKSGQLHYKNMLENHVLPAIGECKLCHLVPSDVQELVRLKLASGLAPQTVLHIKNTISAIFRHAKAMRAYSGDLPTEGVRLPPVNAKERQALTWPQVQMLAAELPEKYGILVTVLALTGMRIGEAVALKWKYVNLDEQARVVDGEILKGYTLAVRQNFVLGELTTVKTRRSRRSIPLSAECWVALSRMQATSIDGQPLSHPENSVFANRKGGPLNWRNVAKRHLKPAAERLGMPWVSFHTFRHTWSTLGQEGGLSAAQMQRLLGHSSAEMTAHYTHLEIEAMRAAMENIGKGKPN